MKRIGLLFGLAATLLSWGRAGVAVDVPGFAPVMVVKDAKLAKVVLKPGPPKTAATFPLPPGGVGGEDPTTGDVSDASIFAYGEQVGVLSGPLVTGRWSALGKDPQNPKGYKYKDPSAATTGGVKVIVLKPKVIKIIAKGDGSLLPGPLGGAAVGVELVVGTTTYCASSEGGTEKQDDLAMWKSTDNPVPAACPAPPPCCAGGSHYAFTAVDLPEVCGELTTVDGMSTDLTCGGLYVGGGGSFAEAPAPLPDLGTTITTIAECAGQSATLAEATLAATGSLRTCTGASCLFGAPIAVATPLVPVVSTCTVARIVGGTAGTLDCATGAGTLALLLDATVHLTGDFLVDPSDTIPGAQPCPLCQAGTCIGGPNNGMACVAHTSDLGDGYPTSHDCPPDPMSAIGVLRVPLTLTTGSVRWTASPATNDDGTVPDQPRVFTGFCRDADDTALFASPAQQCWENGMAVGAPCAGVFETCEQRGDGAFGPNGGGSMTVTLLGAPHRAIFVGPSLGVFVGAFGVPPTFDATTDSAYDLPGPGVVMLLGSGTLCANPMACP